MGRTHASCVEDLQVEASEACVEARRLAVESPAASGAVSVSVLATVGKRAAPRVVVEEVIPAVRRECGNEGLLVALIALLADRVARGGRVVRASLRLVVALVAEPTILVICFGPNLAAPVAPAA